MRGRETKQAVCRLAQRDPGPAVKACRRAPPPIWWWPPPIWRGWAARGLSV